MFGFSFMSHRDIRSGVTEAGRPGLWGSRGGPLLGNSTGRYEARPLEGCFDGSVGGSDPIFLVLSRLLEVVSFLDIERLSAEEGPRGGCSLNCDGPFGMVSEF